MLRVTPPELEQLAESSSVPARRIGASWRFSCAAVMAWLGNVPAKAAESTPTDSPGPLAADELQRVAGAGAAGQPADTERNRDRASATGEGQAIGEAPQEPTAEDVLLRDARVLVGRRDVTLNFGQYYSRNDGTILLTSTDSTTLAAVEQTAFLTTFQARFGVGDESELFGSTSYFDQDNDVFAGVERIANSERSDFGDVNLGYRRTLRREGVGRSNIIGTLGARVPTDDGPYAISAGLGFLKSLDPVALFASVNYTRTFLEDLPDVTLLQPEHRLDVSVGFALALNDTLSLSSSLSGLFTGATEFANTKLRQQDGYSLGFGLTSRVSQRIYLEPAVSFALGGPNDGFAVGLSLFTFGR